MTAAEILTVERRMRPGQYSARGFLTFDQSLAEVVRQDHTTLERLGVSHERLANRLEYLFRNCIGLRGSARVLGLHVAQNSYFGYQCCPFSALPGRTCTEPTCGRTSKEYVITNELVGESMFLTGLHPHLIHDHHFFEGGFYRLDPERAIRVLELPPHTEDRILGTYSCEKRWGFGMRSLVKPDLPSLPHVRRLIEHGTHSEPLPGLHAHLDGELGYLYAPERVIHEDSILLDGSPLHVGVIRGGVEIVRYEDLTYHEDEAMVARLELAAAEVRKRPRGG